MTLYGVTYTMSKFMDIESSWPKLGIFSSYNYPDLRISNNFFFKNIDSNNNEVLRALKLNNMTNYINLAITMLGKWAN